jgi:membrane protease YdiL (CAAX protease family)
MSKNNSDNEVTSKNAFIRTRLFFFLEFVIVLTINLVLYYFALFIDEFLNYIPDTESDWYGTVTYLVYLACTILSSIIGLPLARLLYNSSMVEENQDNFFKLKDFISIFKIKKSNAKYQLLYTILLLFLVFIPLDFLLYLIPGTLDFTIESLLDSPLNSYLLLPGFAQFFLISLIIHTTVGIREELLFRGIGVHRGKKYVGNYPSLIIISIAFGMAHFSYIFFSDEILSAALPSIIWGLSAFIISCVSSLFLLKTNYIWPLIGAHTFNNVISTVVIWLFNNQGLLLWQIILIFYLPLLIISIIIGIIFFGRVKSGLKDFMKISQEYIKISGDSREERIKIILLDIVIGVLFWVPVLFLF